MILFAIFVLFYFICFYFYFIWQFLFHFLFFIYFFYFILFILFLSTFTMIYFLPSFYSLELKNKSKNNKLSFRKFLSSPALSFYLLWRFHKPNTNKHERDWSHLLCVPSFNSHLLEHAAGRSFFLLHHSSRRPSHRPPQPHHQRRQKTRQSPTLCPLFFGATTYQPQTLSSTPKT